MVREREKVFGKILKNHFSDISNIQFLEIGAGGGSNIAFFKEAGIKPENIYANELLNDRVVQLRSNHADIHILEGNALQIQATQKFDVVFQSTVFTSILDTDFRKALAEKMTELTKKTGIVLWYDFIFNNPANPDVRRVTRQEVKKLFPLGKKFTFYRVTLAPPIGRRVGNFYPLLNSIPFLRSHLIAVITF
jgi:phospholipid N-methyltransferase